MTANAIAPNIQLLTNNTFSLKELTFITAYLLNGGNGLDAVKQAGYKGKTDAALCVRASGLLRESKIQQELQAQIEKRESEKIAKPTEILNFYTSVMRGEVLDQFGIEASIDTRIKAANELAKHQIEIPLKLQQKENSNNIGSITLNFIPRKEEE